MQHMQRRVLEFLEGLPRRGDSTVLLATHDCVINAFYADYKGVEFAEYNVDHTNVPGFVARMTLDDSGKIKEFVTL
jgi:broad specificity phosphatase PhoE